MFRKLLLQSVLISIAGSVIAGTILDDLRDRIDLLENGDQITLTYTFEGCYGPYHHGEIEMSLVDDTIYYEHRSFDDQGKNPFVQSGKYDRLFLLNQLGKYIHESASTILGNKINYEITDDISKLVEGSDRIEHRKFVELFQPLVNVFGSDKESIVPKLRTGGFVH